MMDEKTENTARWAHEVVHSAHSLQSQLFERQTTCAKELIRKSTEQWTKRFDSYLSHNLEIIENWKEIHHEQRRKNETKGHLFNPLRSIPIREVTHSKLLGNLLSPNGNHGQGGLFVQSFLEQCCGIFDPKPEIWHVYIEKNDVDLCLWRETPPGVIVIENKSNYAADQSNQLYRYWYRSIYKHDSDPASIQPNGNKPFRILYLVPHTGKTPSLNSLMRPKELSKSDLGLPERLDLSLITTITFKHDIARWLKFCEEKIPEENFRLRAYLQLYREIWT